MPEPNTALEKIPKKYTIQNRKNKLFNQVSYLKYSKNKKFQEELKNEVVLL